MSRNSRHAIYQHKRGLTCGDAFVVVRHVPVVALCFAGFPRKDPSRGDRAAMLREQLQGIHMSGPDNGEMPTVQRCDLTNPQPLRGGDDRGIGCSEGQITVGDDELGYAQPVGGRDRFSDQVPGRQVAQKASLGVHPKSRADQVVGLCDHEHGDDQRSRMCLQQLQAGLVMTVICIDIGIERSGVDQDGYRATSALRISSMRSEMSGCPLWPTPPAISRRRLPVLWSRCASIASRVSSEIVFP